MIEFTKSYKTSDGQVFANIEIAQEHEIFMALKLSDVSLGGQVAKMIVDNKKVLVDILTTTTNSKPKARAINGGTKKRTPKVTVSESSAIMAETINS